MIGKTGKIILASTVGVGIAGYAYYKYAENSLSFSIVGGSLSGLSNGVATANFQLMIKSSMGISFTISTIALNVYVNGAFKGVLQQDHSSVTIIPASGSAILNVSSVINISDVVSASSILSDAFALANGGLNASIQGYCTTKINVPLISLFSINIPVNEVYPL